MVNFRHKPFTPREPVIEMSCNLRPKVYRLDSCDVNDARSKQSRVVTSQQFAQRLKTTFKVFTEIDPVALAQHDARLDTRIINKADGHHMFAFV